MATIKARINAQSANQIELTATRSGGCANCAQKQGCAILWQPMEPKQAIQLPRNEHLQANQNTPTDVEQSCDNIGNEVNLHCEDQALLRYIALLFLPTLSLLLSATLITDVLTPNSGIFYRLIFNGLIPLALGFSISRHYLAKHTHKLLAATTIQPH
ncbi:SoxR reducing system RseC family protein [Reinekea thalattae]|uniref:SoxR reducing system RseC family protein n=1 Tax=Reinekea thalattae TaxID=2593301 RepID=A0A5C8Z4V3_9GAMM|nr:SoxR reducing system RseC family protein [Reinekea thalattae]TXR53052.1 hypothetical protein FME95_00275 [Reinekea thalattae]